jgi:hypothetical protein
MNMNEVNIIGAGFAGLITACAIPKSTIFEAGSYNENHKALLRFRDKSVADLTGIPFKEVTVHKEICHKDIIYHECNISIANCYSNKVSGVFEDRSIWDLKTVNRYIAPPDFYDQLVDRHTKRICWNAEIVPDTIGMGNTMKIINTAPLPIIMAACGLDSSRFEFKSSGIKVDRYELPQTNVYQTIYFPDEDLRVYRASITGDVLIVESISERDHLDRCWGANRYDPVREIRIILMAFGLDCVYDPSDLPQPKTVTQKHGKIIALSKQAREAILYRLTREYNVFSIGRFATWRNILLDDVVKDIEVVKRLMDSSDYGRELVLMNR